MAVKRDVKYAGRWSAADTDFPLGGPKNRTTPTSADGSYFERDFIADYEAFFQRIMTEGGVTANETADTAPTSQFFEALSNLIVPVGAIVYSTLSSQPPGRWVKGNGSALSRTAYADLFARAAASSNYVSQALKDADPEIYAGYYGDGDGSTTFTLPDLRAEFIRAADDGRGIDAGRGIGSFQSATIVSAGDISATTKVSANFYNGLDDIPQTMFDALNSDGNPTLPSYIKTVASTGATTIDFGTGTETAMYVRPRNVAYIAWIRY